MEAGGHKVLGLPHHNGKLCPAEVDKHITEFYAGPSWDHMAAPGMVKQFDTIVKQRGVLLAKGRLLGLQFDTLFTDDLYIRIARHAIDMADRIVRALREKGYKFLIEPKTSCLSSWKTSIWRNLEDHRGGSLGKGRRRTHSRAYCHQLGDL